MKKILQLENIVKTFPGVKALDDVNLDLNEGEIHILLGENGAGKSTLMKILSGAYIADEGKIIIDGKEIKITNPKDAQDQSIAIIYQEFNLIPDLTVAQNIYLGREPCNKFGTIDYAKMEKDSRETLNFLGIDIDPKVRVSTLGVAMQQLVEVAKAISLESGKLKILIMDEPTAALSEVEIAQLFETIKKLKSNGVSIIYISHRLQEISIIGDRITVLRDGKTIGTRNVNETNLDELISMMVGREVTKTRMRLKNHSTDEICLNVQDVHQKNGKLKNVSINVKKGEIVGMSGLVGSGRTELANAIFGIDPIDSGSIELMGKKIKKPSPATSIKNGLGFIPENRKEDGLALNMNIKSNVVQASLKLLFPHLYISSKKETDTASKLCAALQVNTKDMMRLVINLSGGNQQKVVLAKWLCPNSDVLIFDEPTRGIDVGAKEEIHNLMIELTKKGVGILMISSDLPEIINLSDRIYVMREGKIIKELSGETTNQEEIISYAAGKGE